jgi:hypothetical protein
MSEDVIKEAIKNRSLLQVHFFRGSRLIEPYILGNTHERKLALRGYQCAGATSGYSVQEGWKLIFLDDIHSATHSADAFEIRPDYQPNDPEFVEVLAKI